jgi:hypothetical protein
MMLRISSLRGQRQLYALPDKALLHQRPMPRGPASSISPLRDPDYDALNSFQMLTGLRLSEALICCWPDPDQRNQNRLRPFVGVKRLKMLALRLSQFDLFSPSVACFCCDAQHTSYLTMW